MAIETLRIEQFRNLAQQSLQFSPGLNFISGENGSGKSSLLEALFFFSRLKSFRTHKTSELVQNGCDYFRLLGKTFPRLNAATTERIENTAVIGGHSEHHIGMEKSARGAALKIRLDRQTQKVPRPYYNCYDFGDYCAKFYLN